MRKRPRHQTKVGPSITKQSHALECDINVIVRNYDRGAVLSHLMAAQGVYADVSNFGDYREAVDMVRRAEEQFEGLPASIRRYFDNDPQAYLEFHGNATPDEVAKVYAEAVEGSLKAENPLPWVEGLRKASEALEPPAEPPTPTPPEE